MGRLKAHLKLSLSARRAWIEIGKSWRKQSNHQSLSARRAWIEIVFRRYPALCVVVALRKESVDRNRPAVGSLITLGGSLSARRAWIEIGKSWRKQSNHQSLSARRAWIEIVFRRYPALCVVVALRKESVDRNH